MYTWSVFFCSIHHQPYLLSNILAKSQIKPPNLLHKFKCAIQVFRTHPYGCDDGDGVAREWFIAHYMVVRWPGAPCHPQGTHIAYVMLYSKSIAVARIHRVSTYLFIYILGKYWIRIRPPVGELLFSQRSCSGKNLRTKFADGVRCGDFRALDYAKTNFFLLNLVRCTNGSFMQIINI